MNKESVFPTMHERQVAHLVKENHNEIVRLRQQLEEKDAELERVRRACHCIQVTENDLDWIEKSIQRHTGGIDEWWRENGQRLSFRDMASAILLVWESGRAGSEAVKQMLGE